MASNNPSESVTSLLRATSGAGPLTSISEQLQALQSINEAFMQQSAAAMESGQSAGNSGGGSVGSSVLDAIGGLMRGGLGGGLGLSSLISGVTDFFAGRDTSSAPAALTPYVRPLPINLDAGFSGASGQAFGVDSAQGGTPRAMTGGG